MLLLLREQYFIILLSGPNFHSQKCLARNFNINRNQSVSQNRKNRNLFRHSSSRHNLKLIFPAFHFTKKLKINQKQTIPREVKSAKSQRIIVRINQNDKICATLKLKNLFIVQVYILLTTSTKMQRGQMLIDYSKYQPHYEGVSQNIIQ